jgi:hypothetical protein
MDQDTYKMAVALIEALSVANSIEKFADCRDNIYGDIEKAIKRLGPEAEKLKERWSNCGEIIPWDDLRSLGFAVTSYKWPL